MVSVIVPLYNGEKYLSQCIESILNQTYKELEVIIINDGSKDGSEEICRRYLQGDSRIRYFSQENNGVSMARNKGIAEAKGEFLMFVDCDDWLPCNTLEVLVETARLHDSELVIGSYSTFCQGKIKNYVFENRELKGKREVAEMVCKEYLSAIVSSPWMKLYKKSVMQHTQFEKEISLGEDLLFNLNVFRNIEKVNVISDVCYFYRITSDGSLTKSYKESYFDSMKKIYRFADEYINGVENSEKCVISKENIAYKFFLYSVAFAVRKIERGCSAKDCKEYLKKISNDNDVRMTLAFFRNWNIQERIVALLVKRKMINILYIAVKIRSIIR